MGCQCGYAIDDYSMHRWQTDEVGGVSVPLPGISASVLCPLPGVVELQCNLSLFKYVICCFVFSLF